MLLTSKLSTRCHGSICMISLSISTLFWRSEPTSSVLEMSWHYNFSVKKLYIPRLLLSFKADFLFLWVFMDLCCCCCCWWCREIMHAMWRPVRYKYVYVFTCFYVWSITIPHCLAVYWAFGDQLLHKNNAFAVVPSSNFRSAAIVMMIIHQVLRSSPSSDLRLLSSSLLTPFCVAS